MKWPFQRMDDVWRSGSGVHDFDENARYSCGRRQEWLAFTRGRYSRMTEILRVGEMIICEVYFWSVQPL